MSEWQYIHTDRDYSAKRLSPNYPDIITVLSDRAGGEAALAFVLSAVRYIHKYLFLHW